MSGLVLNGGQLFWTSRTLARGSDGTETFHIHAWRPGAAAPSLLASSNDLGGGAPVAVDDRFVYFTELGGTTLARVARGGGPTETIAPVIDGAHVGAVLVDAGFVYWHAQGWHAVSKAGGAPFTIADEAPCETPLLVDGALLCGPSQLAPVIPTIPLTDEERIWELPMWWRDCSPAVGPWDSFDQAVAGVACRRRQKKYESAQSTPVPAAQPHACGPSPTARCAMSAEPRSMAKPA